MSKKYEITKEGTLFQQPYLTLDPFTGRSSQVMIYRIRALRDIPRFGVKAGDLGGWIQNEENLSQDFFCWIHRSSVVLGDARVVGNSYIGDDSLVHGEAVVTGNCFVYESNIGGKSKIVGNSVVSKVKSDKSIIHNSFINLKKSKFNDLDFNCHNVKIDRLVNKSFHIDKEYQNRKNNQLQVKEYII